MGERLDPDIALVALGSNLGDSAAILASAVEALAALPRTELLAHSTWHRTAPVGGPANQSDYLNGAAELRTALEPLELLRALHGIEADHGRDRGREERWGPRRLDLDLLMIGDECRQGEELRLPHPRMEERAFVLEPLAELRPELVLPSCGRTVRARCLELRGEVSA